MSRSQDAALAAALARMRQTLGPLAGAGRDGQSPRERIARPPRGPVPARITAAGNAIERLFIETARAAGASVETVPGLAAVPARIAAYLAGQGLAPRLHRAPDAFTRAVPFPDGTIELAEGPLPPEGGIALASAEAGLAETGSLVVRSGPDRPLAVHLVPETEIVLLDAGDVLPSQEALWERLRRAGGALPRDLTLVTGPSRTGDIEMRVEMGAHGPRRLHILLVGGAPEETAD
ncbi:MAG: LUD domain-containing protein [Alphaproteobacteria bacterium]|nr:LUD domain-containing protein [Alphaproteobacteria bacterium]